MSATYNKLFKVSGNMLLDMLKNRTILHIPKNIPSHFRWASSHHWIGIDNIPLSEVLFVCKEKAGFLLHEQQPKAFMLLLTEGNVPDWINKAPDCAIVIKFDEEDNTLQQIQNSFLQIQNWSNMLEHIAYSSEDVQQLLITCENFLNLPIMIYNNNLQCLARSTRIATPELKKNEKNIARAAVVHKDGIFHYVSKETEPMSCEVLCKSIHTINSHSQTSDNFLIIPSINEPITQGTVDLSAYLLRYLDVRYNKLNISTRSNKDYNQDVFENLLNGKYVSNAALEHFTSSLKIPQDAEYRIITFDTSNLKQFQIDQVRANASKLNRQQSLSLEYHDFVLTLIFTHGTDSSLSTKNLIKSFKKLYRENSEINFMNIAMSQVFDSLTDIHFAYQQTMLCFEYIPFINFEDSSLVYDDLRRICYPFEEIFTYLLINGSGIEKRLFDFSLKHTLLEKLLKDDEEKGTQNIRILATYLFNERKATVVAEKLHMHRNSVLYHIEKIQNRFDINLSDARMREMLMLNIKLFFTRLPAVLAPNNTTD